MSSISDGLRWHEYARSQETVKLVGSNTSVMITFAVFGHNEAPTLAHALEQAQAACKNGDTVWFVDSASTDASRLIATEQGVHVVDAPLGKGNAMATLLAECETTYVCCLDGDIFGSDANIARRLATRVRTHCEDLVLGEFADARSGVLSNTLGVYEPLVNALFPELTGKYGDKPLTGFRAFRVGGATGRMPPDFGIEAHLNIVFGLAGARIGVIEIGEYRGRFLYKPRMGLEIAAAILDLAVRLGRIGAVERPAWDEWVLPVVDHIATFHGEAEKQKEFERKLIELSLRPLPPRHG